MNTWWPLSYRLKWLKFDLIAGLTSAAVVIPKSLAFATIAGLPVEIGFYTALVPMVIYALLGDSNKLSVSTTTTIAILVAAEISAIAPGRTPNELISIAITLAFLVGFFLIIASFLRLGFLANFISAPVLSGFKAGVAIVIIIDQIPKLLGIHIVNDNFTHTLISIIHQLPTINIPTLIVSMISLVIIFNFEWLFPCIPAPLVVLILGIIGTYTFNLHQYGIKLVGTIPSGLPALTIVDFALLKNLWPGALGIALISFTESIAAGKAFLGHDDAVPNANRELFALGTANLLGSFFQSMPAGGGTTQTLINSSAGARSQASELITALCGIVILLFLTPMVSSIPYAILAAIVVATTIALLNPNEFMAILRIRKIEFYWAVVALIGVILLGVLNGILIAIALSLLTLIYEANHPPLYVLGRKKTTNDVFRAIETHPKDETIPGLLILKIEGMLTFASVPRAKEKFFRLINQYHPKVVLLDLSAVPDIEYSALLMLTKGEEQLEQRGIQLQLTALNPRALSVIIRSDLGKKLGTRRMFFNIEKAIDAYIKTQKN